jgi:hypothetical protein
MNGSINKYSVSNVNSAGAASQNSAIKLPSAVRYAAVFLTMFALLNVARQTTYFIGSIHYYGAPQPRDYEGVLHSVLSLILGGMATGLRRGSHKAWWTAVVGGGLFAVRIWKELLHMMHQRSVGYRDADVQIVLLGFAIFMLCAAIFLLLSSQGRKPFWPTFSRTTENGKAYDAPAPETSIR